MSKTTKHNLFSLYISIFLVLLIAGIGYYIYQYLVTTKTLEQTAEQLSLNIETLTQLENDKAQLIEENTNLGGNLAKTMEERDVIERQKRDADDQADHYKKLATYDKQLLAKYSKVYFLNENYGPTALATITPKYVLPENKTRYFLAPAYKFLKKMIEDAEDDGINLRVVSAYRSFAEQQSLKSAYSTQYGVGANTFSADQGYSEHQLGTTVDFGTPEVPGAMSAFEGTTAFAWLTKNAHKYGFIMSYPKNNAHYIYEPWHWRFVGELLAEDLHSDKKNFYDLDQRVIDEYLIKIFD
jgi:LAS superfamily LD-carboxypeptidase LdcB